MALFRSSSSSVVTSKNLVEFKCGKMSIKGKMVSPDERKGLLYIHHGEDSLIHLCWKEREKSKAEEDLIIFPEDCEWKKVAQCTTGRVYVLKFNSSARRMFFWMQEPKEDKDEELAKKVNESLNNPPKMIRSGGSNSSGLSDLTDALGQGNLQELFNNVDHQQLLQMMAASGGLGNLLTSPMRSSRGTRSSSGKTSTQSITSSTTETQPVQSTPSTTKTSTSSSSQNPVQLSQLQSILSQMGVQKPKTPAVDLSEALDTDLMVRIFSDPKIKERLQPHLPKGTESLGVFDEIRSIPRSPHFKQAMASFSSALASGQLGPLLGQFGLPQAAIDAANKGGRKRKIFF